LRDEEGVNQIKKSFKLACLSINLDGSENHYTQRFIEKIQTKPRKIMTEAIENNATKMEIETDNTIIKEELMEIEYIQLK
jgi:hypothetical protein